MCMVCFCVSYVIWYYCCYLFINVCICLCESGCGLNFYCYKCINVVRGCMGIWWMGD